MKEEIIQSISDLFNELPEINRLVFCKLLKFLSTISKFSDINLMTPKNLAIVFAPTLFAIDIKNMDALQFVRVNNLFVDLLEIMIDNYYEITHGTQSPKILKNTVNIKTIRSIQETITERSDICPDISEIDSEIFNSIKGFLDESEEYFTIAERRSKPKLKESVTNPKFFTFFPEQI